MGNYYGLLTYEDNHLSDDEKKKIEKDLKHIAETCYCDKMDKKDIPEKMGDVKVKYYSKTFFVFSDGYKADHIHEYRVHKFLIMALNYIRENGVQEYEIYVQKDKNIYREQYTQYE